ncbi:MAG: hypothetical protein D6B25_17620 [Desulfobulbaceae bacterium]|nr:MAG: hypothetical protein D6B25_17620 [Desulfobulbaceae bacterium]
MGVQPSEQRSVSALGRTEHRPAIFMWSSVMMRAAHQFGAAFFLLAYFFKGLAIPGYLINLALISGVLLMLLEWMRHRQIYRELSGIVTLIKIGLLGLVYHGWLPGALAIPVIFVLASIFAHMPKQYRHRLLF